MPFLRLQFLLLCNLYVFLSFSQVPVTDASGQITNLSEAKSQKIIDEVRFYEPDGNIRIPYSKIAGSPFWRDEFLPAIIYIAAGQGYTASIRLNLVTNEIHFLKNNQEMVLVGLTIGKIVFDAVKDSIVFLANVPNLYMNNKKVNDYVQVLTMGDYQLIKYLKRTLSSADSLFRSQKRYFFADDVNYFLRFHEKIDRIKKLNKDNFIKLLPSFSSFSEWINENKIDFKKEIDVIRFLNHYNDTNIN